MRPRKACLILVLAGTTAAPAAAQSWESPTFFAPLPHDDIGLYLVKFEADDRFGFHGIWRQSGNINLGVRGGIGPGNIDWLLGAEFYGPLRVFGPDSPILASWIISGGALFTEDRFGDNVTALRIPAGVSVGFQTGTTAFSVVPYAYPRLAFDVLTVGEGEDEDTDSELNLELDLGADLTVSERFVVRGGVTLGKNTTFGVGGAYRIPRRVVVR